jgi:hypothetical protein
VFDVSTAAAFEGLIGIGTPAQWPRRSGNPFEAIRDGQMAFVKDTIKQVTGRQSRTFLSGTQKQRSSISSRI